MDLKAIHKKNKKRIPSDEDANSSPKKVRSPSIPTRSEAGSRAEAERWLGGLLSQMKPLLSDLVQMEVKSAFETHFHSLLESLSNRESKEKREEVIIGGEIEKYKLVFCDEIGSTIFTNNEIRAENGEPLRVAICDATTNTIIFTGLLSSAQVEFFVLDGEYGSGHQEKETHRTLSDFYKSILSPREGKRPLMVGNDQKLNLENGLCFVKNLCITDNSSWMKSKKFRLGAIIKDEKILAEFPSIGVAVSQPFRVMDHRGEVNKKHHPPSRDDDVWRLEGIGKDGAYHKNLSFHGIRTVGDFLNAYREMGSTSLRKLLGIKVPKKTWMMMVENAFECVSIPTYQQSSKEILAMGAEEEAFIESFEVQKNLGYDLQIPQISCFEEAFDAFGYDVPTPAFFPGEASSSYEAAAQAIPRKIKDLGAS